MQRYASPLARSDGVKIRDFVTKRDSEETSSSQQGYHKCQPEDKSMRMKETDGMRGKWDENARKTCSSRQSSNARLTDAASLLQAQSTP